MRTIKFRGKLISSGKWVYGSLLQSENGTCAICSIENVNSPWPEVIVKPETVCQFTGLCDVNGTEIYEGDILEISDGVIETVEWDLDNHPYAAGYITRDADKMVCAYPLNLYWVENKLPRVIGNIYDNLELIK
jgi:uncharacterized phage protein (TIGR01671 family)